jgi:hypothetical protein
MERSLAQQTDDQQPHQRGWRRSVCAPSGPRAGGSLTIVETRRNEDPFVRLSGRGSGRAFAGDAAPHASDVKERSGTIRCATGFPIRSRVPSPG